MTPSWTDNLQHVTPANVVKWSAVVFLSCLEVLALIAITSWLVGWL